jgi:hypothetical protein
VAVRAWGESVDGFALSIEQVPQEEAGAPPSLSVVLRNVGGSARTLVAPGWLQFYRIDIDAALSPFGRELLKPERQTEVTVTLEAGATVDTQVPIGALFDLGGKGEYRTRVSCTLPSGQTLTSNETAISI